MATPDASSVVSDALNEFFGELYTFFETLFKRFFKNLYTSFVDVSASRWTKVVCSVVGYILIRPYIEAWFAKMHEKDRKKQLEKERAAREGKGEKKAKVSANALRGGGGGGGKVLGEVENTDDEIEEGEDFATASGVPEWGKNARKRQKKYMRELQREAEQRSSQNLTEDQVMELLDWSDSEDEQTKEEKKDE
ncbi:uncharacterized protein ACLA_084660 [Aspergillus clavatus NRRL 1]|uniref:Trafficking PGA2 n=1 Tax=Aspergillus clavatus (strain ATCC 1007 / CBS 513.65 / DSM 816 / NCTC 3887 / NRRL 1 / QM 1276 / 107) TaxID=344612 RepID=A1CTY4_ASPCL|nr:uncharacterized protein ACLA_084660 [Aspergillus clavatus NRRL 1]EAW06771.1 conserved hypothetical protein [Aspergillus clavatus NRRL 1]